MKESLKWGVVSFDPLYGFLIDHRQPCLRLHQSFVRSTLIVLRRFD